MKDEKKIVLQLLEEQKINKDDALKLLEALDKAKAADKNKVDISKTLDTAKKKFGDVSLKASKKYEEIKPEIKKASKKTKDSISDIYKDISSNIKKKSTEDEIFYADENIENESIDSVIELGTDAQPIKRISESIMFEDNIEDSKEEDIKYL